MNTNRSIILRRRSRRGFVMITDLITAMSIVAILIIVLAIAIAAQRRAELRLADQSLALRQAEATLASLQQPSPPSRAAANIQITSLAPGWARVTVKINRASASLVGPVEAMP